ncbi:MAG TPA: hypothetical protein VHR45_14480 [Thermoanaerobaculia bacterium]|nr:hypothetical protein [Thermoanaerobaculia bacterium]
MIILTAGTLAIGATAGWMLEQRYGESVLRWARLRLGRLRLGRLRQRR